MIPSKVRNKYTFEIFDVIDYLLCEKIETCPMMIKDRIFNEVCGGYKLSLRGLFFLIKQDCEYKYTPVESRICKPELSFYSRDTHTTNNDTPTTKTICQDDTTEYTTAD